MYPSGRYDSELVPNDDSSSPEIPIMTTFPYFDKNHNSLFVNTNGAISFERPVSQYTPQPFPLGDNRILIAPFWADVDIRRRGKVFYRQISNRDQFGRAKKDIRKAFSKQERFTPTWLFIATWSKVPFFGDRTSNQSISNTFQLVLVTNGRHSFVIFIYEEIQWTTGTASGGNSNGTGGTEAECGFNAGDGINSFSITRSNQSTLFALPTTSNVQSPGVWIFRIDKAKIEKGGCNTKGFLIFPHGNKDSMHGGVNIKVAGPCFEEKDIALCKFDTQAATPGTIVGNGDGVHLQCTAPMVNHTKKATMKVSLDSGESFPFQGQFQYVSIEEMRGRAKIYLKDSPNWKENRNVEIIWNIRALGSTSVKVKVQIARYIFENNAAKFHSFFDLREQNNSGNSQFLIPKQEGTGLSDLKGNGRFVSFIRVIKETLYQTMEQSSNEWIWSDVITWTLPSKIHETNCKNWYKIQPDPKLHTEGSDLLACPPTREKALRDIGRYQSYIRKDPFSNQEVTKCIRTIIPSNTSAGQECCYNKNSGNLIIAPPNSGKLVRTHRKSGIPFISNYFHDVLPHQDCCRSSDVNQVRRMCPLFYEKRPPDNGKKYEPPRPAVTVGEPHLITLDGVQYTFNGIGEYHILKIMRNGFTLQGRMEQMPKLNNTQINATVYTAFAMTETGSDIIQINLNGRGFVDVYVNAQDVDFDGEDLFEFSNGFILKSSNVSSYSVVFHSGICVTVEGYPDLLQSLIIVPEKYKGNTSGLFGLWDDDKENEFLLPNGTFLNTTSSPETIHYDFGLKWATKNNESLFFYPNGKNHSSFYKPDFLPAFLDYRNLTFEDQNLESEARRICGENLQCLFDIKITGKTSIGLSSRKSLEEFREIVKVTEKKDCLPIDPVLENGITKRNDAEDGILAYYFQCNSHHVLNGPEGILCKHGVWNGTKPRCIECVLEDPNLIAQITEKTSHEIAYQLYCKNGYNKNGPNSLRCIRGKWTRNQPICIKQNQTSEEMSVLHIALISVGCALFLVIILIITRGLVKSRLNKRKGIIKGRETMGHQVEGGVNYGEQNKVMMLSFSNLKVSSESTKG